MILRIVFISLVLGLYIPGFAQKNNHKWNFDNLDGWEYGHQDNNPNNQCEINNGILKIFTLGNSRDRKKIHTADKIYTSGRYTWRTFIPHLEEKAQVSVGSWIYCDDHHELDFEVGYGKEAVREKLGADSDEMIVYMTSQDFPFYSQPMKIKTGWHIFEIDLKEHQGRYWATWYIDGEKKQQVQLQYGSETQFYIFCSVENLTFIGEQLPAHENFGLFDYVKFKYHK